MFFVLSIFNLALMSIYSSHSGYEKLKSSSFFSQYTLGNLGQSEAICSSVNFGVQKNIVTCPIGSIQKIQSFGIIPPSNVETKKSNVFFDLFKRRDRGSRCLNKPDDFCNQVVDRDLMNITLTQQCLGQHSCKIADFTKFISSSSNSTAV